jgi:hypothetical protein
MAHSIFSVVRNPVATAPGSDLNRPSRALYELNELNKLYKLNELFCYTLI